MKFGNKLVKLRKEHKLSQEDLAYKLEVSRQTISNWELNVTKPDIEYIKKISKVFCISIDEILENDVRNIIEKKISNTEKLTNKNTKNIKILLITLYCIILSTLIFVIIYYSTKKDFTNKYQNIWICSLEEDIGDDRIDTDTYYLYWSGMEDGSFSAFVDYSSTNTIYDENIPKGIYGDIVLDDFNLGSNFDEMIIFLEHRKNNLIYRGATCR